VVAVLLLRFVEHFLLTPVFKIGCFCFIDMIAISDFFAESWNLNF
jgi:hypothetical protein